MTEEEWLVSADPTPMLNYIRGKTSIRKSRLYACGLCRATWDILVDKRSRIALRRLEAFADDISNSKLRQDAYNTANAAYREMTYESDQSHRAAACAVVMAAWLPALQERDGNIITALDTLLGQRVTVELFEATLLRDIFGNPFHPSTLTPSCITSTVTALACQMYELRDLSAMPVLADALQDAGCENVEILNHCRSPQTHVRGCWVVDLVLGKE